MTTASQIPPARAVFTDGNGVPISGGFVNTYVAGTTTPKATWQDVLETIPNANPVLLDGSGSCLLFGTGTYSLAVTDSLGNAVPGFSGFSQAPGFISDAMLPVVGALTLPLAMAAFGINAAIQPFLASSSMVAATALLRWLGSTNGSIARPIDAKIQELGVSPLDFGAVGDGGTNDTLAFVAALTSQIASTSTKGGRVVLPAGYKFLVDNFTVPSGVSLVGPYVDMGAPVATNSAPYGSYASLLLSAGSTITMGPASTAAGLLVVPAGMAFPQASSAAWAGTAFTVDGDDVMIRDSMILGFDRAVFSTTGLPLGWSRLTMHDVKIDCQNGVLVDASEDTFRLCDVHCWPFATIPAALTRTGRGFEITNCGDWGRLLNCFTYGYAFGFIVTNSNSIHLEMCGADNTGAGTGTGFLINGTSTATTLLNCQAAAQIAGFDITETFPNVLTQMIGCEAWGNTSSGILIEAAAQGDVKIFGGAVYNNTAAGVSINSATPRIDIDGVWFNNNGTPILAGIATTNVRLGPTCNFAALAAGTAAMGAGATCPSVASASVMAISATGDLFNVTGVTNIGTLTSGWAGRRVTLIFNGILAVLSSTASTQSMRLSGAANFTTSNGATLTLAHNGAQWWEVGRSA